MARSAAKKSTRPAVVAGVDAGRVGDDLVWVMASCHASAGAYVRFEVYGSFRELWHAATDGRMDVVAIDMPLGLPSTESLRSCEEAARNRLGKDRRDTVFMSPPLWLASSSDPEQERRWEARVRQGRARENPLRLLQRCREVRDVLDVGALGESTRPRAVEVHAEVCFWKLNGERATSIEKRAPGGPDERLELLRPQFAGIAETLHDVEQRHGPKSHRYDFLDAAAAAWTARRILSGDAEPLSAPEFDAQGYPMSIWV